MPLVVEDGTGKADAVTYVDVAYFRAYWTARGIVFAESDAELEPRVVNGSDWVDSHELGGLPTTTTQALAIPRRAWIVGARNPRLTAGTEIGRNTVPEVVKQAVCEAARADMTEALHAEVDERRLLTSKRVGAITKVFYRPDGRRRFPRAEALLAGLHNDEGSGPSVRILRS